MKGDFLYQFGPKVHPNTANFNSQDWFGKIWELIFAVLGWTFGLKAFYFTLLWAWASRVMTILHLYILTSPTKCEEKRRIIHCKLHKNTTRLSQPWYNKMENSITKSFWQICYKTAAVCFWFVVAKNSFSQ